MNEDLRTWVIWSFEHDAWWRPGRAGYTTQLAEAGHYSLAEAEQIVAHANRYATQIHEQAMPHSTAHAYALKGWHPLTPGTYDDGRGGLHLVLEEMLAAHGYADTPANREQVIAAARELIGCDTVHVIE